MPQPLRDANLAPRWWPASATNTFVLFTMKDASMSYHIDLWATAVCLILSTTKGSYYPILSSTIGS